VKRLATSLCFRIGGAGGMTGRIRDTGRCRGHTWDRKGRSYVHWESGRDIEAAIAGRVSCWAAGLGLLLGQGLLLKEIGRDIDEDRKRLTDPIYSSFCKQA
jgi:hypothetical protein